MIASLLDPSGEHYQSNLFLDKFLEVLNVPEFQIDSEKCSVYREYKNIDLYITDSNKHIIMENKIYARDQKEQIKRYIEIIKKENSNLKFVTNHPLKKRIPPKNRDQSIKFIDSSFLSSINNRPDISIINCTIK